MHLGGGGERRPPGPRGHWLAGNLSAYEQDRLGFLLQMRNRYGPVVRFGSHTTLLNDAGTVDRLLRNRTDTFAIRENFLQRRINDQQSRDILELRAALNPGLRRRAVHSITAIVERQVASCLEAIVGPSRVGVDPLPVLERAISVAVAEFYFGAADARDIAGEVGHLLDDLSQAIGNPFALPPSWGSPLRRRIDIKHRGLRRRVSEFLRARETRNGVDDLAGDIVARVDGRFPREQVADLVIGSLLAAHRVPAAAASWLLMLLADHPHVQHSLRAVAAEAAPDPPAPAQVRPTGSRVTVEQVVLESLRLFPPTWLIVRTSTRPVRVGGFAFPAGHHFMISPYVLHRDPRHYEAPEVFLPHRWDAPHRVATGYLPFGSGIHACPGRHLASLLLATIATTVTERYSIARGPEPVTPNPRTTLLPDGLRITLVSTVSTAERQTKSSDDSPSQLLLADPSLF